MVAGGGDGGEVFEAGRPLGDEAVLDELVFVTAEARLVVSRFGQSLVVVAHRLAHRFEDAGALRERNGGEERLSDGGGAHGFADGGEDAEALGNRGRLRSRHVAAGDVGGDAPRDLVDFPVGQTCGHDVTSCTSRRRRRTRSRRWP